MHKLVGTPQAEDEIIFAALQQVQPEALIDHAAEEDRAENAASGGPYRLPLEAYDVSLKTGFLPEGGNERSLPSDLPEYAWEQALQEAKKANLRLCGTTATSYSDAKAAQRWLDTIASLPVISELSPTIASEKRLLRRAYVVICMLGHFFMHSMPEPTSAWSFRNTAFGNVLQNWTGPWSGHITSLTPRTTVPRALAVPWILVAEKLGLQPIISYASEIMWNWAPTAAGTSSSEAPDPYEIEALESFTGSGSEDAFNLAPVRVELVGAEAIRILHRTVTSHLAGTDATSAAAAITADLVQLRSTLRRMAAHVAELKQTCNPVHFYWAQRPWITGTPPGGWTYDLGDRQRRYNLSGATAGATSLLQTIDAFLGVEHQGAHGKFRDEMKDYMPAPHRRFVDLVESMTTDRVWTQELKAQLRPRCNQAALRGFVLAYQSSGRSGAKELVEAYNGAIHGLDEFRREHFIVIAKFVILQAKGEAPPEFRRQAPPTNTPGSEGGSDYGFGGDEKPKSRLQGTGGSDLSTLLKGYKSSTTDALITT